MPLYSGSLFKHGILWAGIAVGFWGLVSLTNSRATVVLAMLAWALFWYLVLYRNAERHARRKH